MYCVVRGYRLRLFELDDLIERPFTHSASAKLTRRQRVQLLPMYAGGQKSEHWAIFGPTSQCRAALGKSYIRQMHVSHWVTNAACPAKLH